MDEKPDDQRVGLVCALADVPFMVPGSSFDRECYMCHRQVMIAPSGLKALKQHGDAVIMCHECFRRIPKEGVSIQPEPTAEMRAELQRAVPNTWRMRN